MEQYCRSRVAEDGKCRSVMVLSRRRSECRVAKGGKEKGWEGREELHSLSENIHPRSAFKISVTA